MQYDLEVLSRMVGQKVYWYERVFDKFIRLHLDQERYLSNCIDIEEATLFSDYLECTQIMEV